MKSVSSHNQLPYITRLLESQDYKPCFPILMLNYSQLHYLLSKKWSNLFYYLHPPLFSFSLLNDKLHFLRIQIVVVVRRCESCRFLFVLHKTHKKCTTVVINLCILTQTYTLLQTTKNYPLSLPYPATSLNV